MKNILFKNIAFVVLIILCSTACQEQEDFLTQVNPNELSTGSFWKNNLDLGYGLVSVYNGFKDTNIYNIISENHRADMTYPGFGRPNPNNQFVPYYIHTFNDSQNEINNKWEALYVVIFRANQVIENGKRLIETYTNPDNIDAANLIIAQARFFRGIAYSYLYNSFNNGSVVIFDFVPVSENEFYQPLSSAADVKAFYLEDLEHAYANLPANWENTIDLGRVTAPAAAAELGRSYLYEGNYTKASEYFTDIITNPAYGRRLVNNIGDNFSEAGEFNSESILEISYSVDFKSELGAGDGKNVSNTLGRTFSPGNLGGFRVSMPSCWLQIAYKSEQKDTSDPRNYVPCVSGSAGCDPVTLTKLRKYSLRTSNSVALVDEPDLTYYDDYLPGVIAPFNNSETAYFRKYTNWATVATEADFVPNSRSGINIRLVRLAEIMLMQAECLIKGGTDNAGVNQAMALINEVRHRSALQLLGPNGSGSYPGADHDDVTYTAQTLMEHLMYVEKPLELAEEGHAVRFFDLRRWGVLKARFQDLSTRIYAADDFATVNTLGQNVTRFQAALREGPPSNANRRTFTDYTEAATNFNENIHGYYPIPNSEVTANPNLYN